MSHILERQNLNDAIHPMLAPFDSWTQQKGRRYFASGRVLNLDLDRDGFTAVVQGSISEPYECEVNLSADRQRISRASCNCPVGLYCKHLAAATLAYIQQYGKTVEQESGSGQSLNRKVQYTLESLVKRIAAPEEPEAPNPTRGKKSQLFYVLSDGNWAGMPSITTVVCNIKKDGSVGSSKIVSADFVVRNQSDYITKADRDIAAIRDALNSRLISSFVPWELTVKEMIVKMIKTGRCFLDTHESQPLTEGPPLPGRFYWRRTPVGKVLSFAVTTEDSREIECLRWVVPFYVDKQNSTIGPAETRFDYETMKLAYSLPPLNESEAEQSAVLLQQLNAPAEIPLPDETVKIIRKDFHPAPRLKLDMQVVESYLFDLERTVSKGQKIPVAELTFGYPEWTGTDEARKNLIAPGQDIERVYVGDDGQRTIARKLVSEETNFLLKLDELRFNRLYSESLRTNHSEGIFFTPEPGALADFIARHKNQLEADGWKIDISPSLEIIDASNDDLSLDVEEGEDWWLSFSLDLTLGDKKIPLLPVILQALRSVSSFEGISEQTIEKLNLDGKFYGETSDGKVIRLPFDRIRPIIKSLYELLDRHKFSKSGHMSISAQQLAVIARDLKWTGSENLRELIERLKGFLSDTSPMDPSPNFKTTLRDYQKDGLGWLARLARYELGGILADDMGLGKTVQLLAHIQLEREKNSSAAPFLVVAPTSVLPNWNSECARFAPELKVTTIHGANRTDKYEEAKSADLVLTTYPILMRDHKEFKKITWHGVALDEAQAIKNATTKVARSAFELEAGHRICLTGTPVENHLGELWSQFNFLMSGMLGDHSTFKAVFQTPIEKFSDMERRRLLAARVKPFLVRRTKKEVASELPDKTTIIQNLELDGPQRDLYETVRVTSLKQVRDEIARKGFEKSQILILEALLRLRQVCCDPRLVHIPQARKVTQSAKLEVLLDMLQQLTEEGRKIIVFSQFTSMLDLIVPELSKLEIKYTQLRGDTKDRKAPVDEFQNGDAAVFLISLKAGGTGLNLTAADTVIHYDPWWNPAVEDQATDRAHRIGQTKNVFVYKLIAQGTIEKRMLELQEKKRRLAGAIYSANNDLSVKFTESDLEMLFSPIDGN